MCIFVALYIQPNFEILQVSQITHIEHLFLIQINFILTYEYTI